MSLVTDAFVYLVSPTIPMKSSRCNCSIVSNLSMPNLVDVYNLMLSGIAVSLERVEIQISNWFVWFRE